MLGEIDTITPWSALRAQIESFYPRGEGRGRPPVGREQMLRRVVAPPCFLLADEGTEDALDDSQAIRRLIGIDLARERAPDAMTRLKFRRLREQHQRIERLFAAINEPLARHRLLLREGNVLDARIIAAPSSTQNPKGERDPERHPTQKGNPWHFGMKAHLGADAPSGLVHPLGTTATHTPDVTPAHALLHGEERIAFGDAGDQGVEKCEANRTPEVKWPVALRPGQRRALLDNELSRIEAKIEQRKARVRAKVEPPFHILNNLFLLQKVRYRGRVKNTAPLLTLFGLANRLMAKRRILAINAQCAS